MTTIASASVSTKYSFDFELDVQCASAIQEITSPCNQLKVDIHPDDKRRAKVRLDEEYQFDADVQVQVLACKPFEPHALLEDCVTASGEDTNDVMSKPVVMLNFVPELHSSAELGEFIFVVDRSGSMSGSKIKSARETLLLFLKSLPGDCYFNVVGFGSSHQKLFKKSKVYNDSSVDKACSHAQSMEADLGGTEILRPLEDVFSQPLIKGYPRQVFLLTDGEVGNTQQVIDLARRNADKARCFALGIGSGASTALIKGVAKAGRGKAEFVRSADHMQSKVIKMLKNALQPALLDCKVSWDLPKGCNAESVPNPLPAVFSGESLVVYGVLTLPKGKDVKPLTGTVTLTATLSTASGGEQVKHKVSFEGVPSESGGNKLLHRLAAKCLIQAKQQHQDDSNRDDEKEEIISLSKSANVISKLTSFVAVDETSHEPVSRAMIKPSPNTMMGGGGCDPSLLRPSRKACFRPSQFNQNQWISSMSSSPPWPTAAQDSRSKSASFKVMGGCVPDSAPPRETVYGGGGCDPSLLGATPMACFRPSQFNQKQWISSMSSSPPWPAAAQDSRSKSASFKNDCVPDSAPPRKTLYGGGGGVGLFGAAAPVSSSFLASASLSSPAHMPPRGNYLLNLVTLQKASGSWQLTELLARICGVTMEKLKQTCPSQLTDSNKESVWATALALSCLFGKFKGKKDEWEMVADKGIKWLKKTIDDKVLSYEKIMEMAGNALGN